MRRLERTKSFSIMFFVVFCMLGFACSAALASEFHVPEESVESEKSKIATQHLREVTQTPNSVNLKKSAAWIDLSPDLIGLVNQKEGVLPSLRKSADSSSFINDVSIDGILINVDGDFEQHRSKVVAALEDGMIVVLDSSGSEISQARIQDLSVEFAHIGVRAAAVMLYKGGPNEGVGLLPFAANETNELTALMKKVSRRSADAPAPQ